MKLDSEYRSLMSLPYSKFLFAIFIAAFIEAVIIPPVQSPDEHDHLKRAYLLSQGRLIMDAPPGNMSGGFIDTGLIQYIDTFYKLHNSSDMKLSLPYIEAAQVIRWTGVSAYTAAPGTGFYFPLSYAPQALGLWLGETLGLSVDASCKLARLLSLACTVGIIAFAFSIYSPSILVMSLLVLPMTLFQISTAGLDGISIALEIAIISLFLKIINSSLNGLRLLNPLLNICVILLASSRVHMLPLLIFPFLTAYRAKSRAAWLLPLLSSLFVFSWIVTAIKTTVDTRVDTGAPILKIIEYYIYDPFSFLQVVGKTLATPDTINLYYKSFIGILGWLDAWLTLTNYNVIGSMLLAIAFLSCALHRGALDIRISGLFIFLSLISTALIFFALLITWNKHPANFISGIQGRYFMGPCLLFAYGVSYGQEIPMPWLRFFALVLLGFFSLYCIEITTECLLNRYWLSN